MSVQAERFVKSRNICMFGPPHLSDTDRGEADSEQNQTSPVAEAGDHIVRTATTQQVWQSKTMSTQTQTR